MTKRTFLFIILVSIGLNSKRLSSQVQWTRSAQNPVFPTQGIVAVNPSGFKAVVAPTVLYDSAQSLFKMWFTSQSTRSDRFVISYAISMDGISWYPYAKNPVLVGGSPGAFDEDILVPRVLRVGNEYHMYYTGMNPSARKIGLARSTDGIVWQKAAENPVLSPSDTTWDSKMIGWCDVVKVDTGYFMWYNGSTTTGGWNGIGLATSTNGIQWTKYSGNPVFTPQPAAWDFIEVATPSIVRVDSQFYMIYLGQQPAGPLISPYSAGLATSSDGKQWTRYPGNPVFPHTANWDYSIGTASLMYRNGKFHLWYSGFQTPEANWQIGYAVSDSAATTGVASPEEIPGEFKLLPAYPNPFNPITNVEFALPTRSAVRLAVYDVLGRLVTTLVNEVRPAGTYTAKFDGRGLSSGTYYCRMEVGSFVSTAKILLIK